MPFNSTDRIVLACLYSLSTIIGIIGNTIVLLSICLRKRARKTQSNIYILSLAGIDLLSCTLCGPYYLRSLFVTEFFKSDVTGYKLCVAILVNAYALAIGSILSLTLLSIDRYCAVRLPFWYRKKVNRKHCIIAVLITWLYSFLIVLPPAFIPGWIAYENEPGSPCGFQWQKANALYLGFNIVFNVAIPAIAVFLTNIAVFKTARKQKLKTQPVVGRKSRSGKDRTSKSSAFSNRPGFEKSGHKTAMRWMSGHRNESTDIRNTSKVVENCEEVNWQSQVMQPSVCRFDQYNASDVDRNNTERVATTKSDCVFQYPKLPNETFIDENEITPTSNSTGRSEYTDQAILSLVEKDEETRNSPKASSPVEFGERKNKTSEVRGRKAHRACSKGRNSVKKITNLSIKVKRQAKTRMRLAGRSEIKLVLSTVSLSLGFLLAWIPFVALRVLKSATNLQISEKAVNYSSVFTIMNSAWNPFIILFTRRNIHHGFIMLLRNLYRRYSEKN